MRTATIIESVNTRQVPVREWGEYVPYHHMETGIAHTMGPRPTDPLGIFDPTAAFVVEHIPICRLRSSFAPDVYVGMTESVSSLLNFPYKEIIEGQKAAEEVARHHQAQHAALMDDIKSTRQSIWKRLRFLFTGELS